MAKGLKSFLPISSSASDVQCSSLKLRDGYIQMRKNMLNKLSFSVISV